MARYFKENNNIYLNLQLTDTLLLKFHLCLI